ncbi:MAG: protein translocase subunit SecDF [Bacteroidetes bacterium]|nr:protein translocase subunit SecDF [Bacteroidota bacterium]
MQSKGVVRFFLIALTLVCLYQFLLIIPTNNVESKARSYAHDMVSRNPKVAWNTYYSQYLDSLSTETVFSIPLIKKFTYADLKKSQLAMGLDLKGGMSVLLQVDLRDFIKSLSLGNSDPVIDQALTKATELQKTQQADFITLFAQTWKELSGGKPLASVFARNESLKGKINFDSPDADVLRTLRDLANQTVGETYKRLKQRIDKLGVVQPNVSLDATRDLILVELPGIDNPERARNMLQRSAKLEFWDTYRMGDEGVAAQLVAADQKLKGLLSGDTTAQTNIVKDTTYEYPKGANGLPDTTKAKEMVVKERKLDQSEQTAGPLRAILELNNQGASPVIGYADKNKMKLVDEYLSRPEIASMFPADLAFKWAQKGIEDKGESGKTGVGKFILYAIKKRSSDGKAPLDGSVVTNASEQPDPTSGQITVSLSMNNDGAKIWADMTRRAYEGGRREIAILLDDEVVSAPSVNGAIEGGNSQITGNFSLDEAKDLASILQVGKLPAGTHIVQESQVGPSLGAENINKSLFTMILSVLMLCGFMIAYYNKGGLISVIALLANLFFIIGTLASMGTVLTLPGIAGIVLTLATAIDANVIIYERIREELRNGMPMVKAVAEGFHRALSAIIDANVTTLLTAMVLMYFGLGPIKGFGTVLLVGILCSLFTAVLVGRMLTDYWIERGWDINYSRKWSENWLVGFHYDWMGKRRIAYIFSATLILIGVASFFTRGFELGVDFKGGFSFNVQFDQAVDIEKLRSTLTTTLEGNPVIKAVNTQNTYNITTSYLINEQSPDVTERVIAKMHEGVVAAGYNSDLANFRKTDGYGTHITSSSQVGPTVADDIRSSSFLAAFWALALIFIFLLIRFRRWQFSLGAVLSLFHDVLITIGFFSLLHGIVPFSLEIDQAIIACILTVIGYSVNDTVIVYDRIREFINTFSGRKKEEVFNLAINTTLSRTLITSGTVFLVVLLLFLFGGSAIKGFAFGMLVGMFFGTYSSVFIASAFVIDLTREDIISGKAPVTASAKVETSGKKTPTK